MSDSRKISNAGVALISVFLGFLVFLLIFGLNILNPYSYNWLFDGDFATNYIGLGFFISDVWRHPLGLNPNYGELLSSTIYYSDSIPFLAMLHKFLHKHFDVGYQYFGIWFLICCILQSFFSIKVLSNFTGNIIILIVGQAFFLLAPPFLYRSTMHVALSSHFLIISCIYLQTKPFKGTNIWFYQWLIITCASASINPYIFFIVNLFFCSEIIRIFINRLIPFSQLAKYSLLISLFAIFIFYESGGFVQGTELSATGYAFFKANVFSLFNSMGWSYILPPISIGPGEYEGFAYLGLGIIGLILLLICLFLKRGLPDIQQVRYPLAVCLVAALLSFSNKLGFSTYNLNLFENDQLISVFSIFRSSGRFIWPLYYIIIVITVKITIDFFGEKKAKVLILLFFILQLIDITPGILKVRSAFVEASSKNWFVPLVSQFWKDAARSCRRVVWYPPANISPHWRSISYYAMTHDMTTNAPYLARDSRTGLQRSYLEYQDLLKENRVDLSAIYVLNERDYNYYVGKNPDTVFFHGIVDSLFVLAPCIKGGGR